MRLKKLILHGFKSFADRTEFSFDSPITGIVGPNGCGKSNVVDAFKWVLGEQSAKSLRGDAMMDVIFNGSGNRKPAAMSEVTLVFENPKRDDGTRLLSLDTEEVSVGRRLWRDGTSEYQVNNHASRLKDIRELFLDTGVGVDAYSVIEQGRVSALLEANPDERRLIFEEAAGISKFKQRKKESQRKLEKVDQNLLRVNDIVEEVEKRLRSVKVQAGRARTFQEHSLRLRELRLMYALHDYHTHHGQLAQVRAEREDVQFRLEDAGVDLTRAQSDLAQRREALEKLAQEKQRVEHELVQVQAQISSARQRQTFAAQQLQQMADQVESFAADSAAVGQKLTALDASLASDAQALEALNAELTERRQQIEERQAAYKQDQLQLNSAASELEQNKAAILELMRKLAAAGSRLGALEIEQKNIASQQQRLTDRRGVVEQEQAKLQEQRAGAQVSLEEALGVIAQKQASLEQCRRDAQQLGQQIARLSEQLGAAREHRSGLVSRQKLLRDLEAKREGVSEGVKAVLQRRGSEFPFVRGLVADVLRVDVEHAHVIEAALDGRDQWLVTDDPAALLGAGEAMQDLEGRVNFIPADQSHGDSAPAYDWNALGCGVRMAIDLVRFEPGDADIAGRLLGRTVVVDDLAVAGVLHRDGPAGYRYVTAAGDVLEADGVLHAGPLSAAMGLLSRHAELDALTLQIAEVDGRIETLTGQVNEGNAAAKSLQEQENSLRNELYKANTTKVERSSQIAQINDRQSALSRELPVLERELNSLADQKQKVQTESGQLVEKRRQLETDQSQRQAKVVELNDAQQKLTQELRLLGEELTTQRVTLGQVQEKQLGLAQHVQRQKGVQAEMIQQAQRLERAIEAVAGKRGEVQRELDVAEHAEHAATSRQGELAEQAVTVAGRVRETGELVQQLSAQVESLRAEHAQVEQGLHQLELRAGELKVRLETLVQRTLDELQLDLPAHYDQTQDAGGYQPCEANWEQVAEEISQLRERIGRLGNVNLDAIGEQEELDKRSEFLSTQVRDLGESKRQLQELIDTINAESGLRFEQTFNAVREHFQAMFRKLFGGGKADIFLETELPQGTPAAADDGTLLPADKKIIDVLDAGIEIIARPPGKQPVSISQLSGGEKTMTCVALLMSIFKSKPSPFCILDEVDAALDEANNARFNQIVQEFLQQSQFIIITHSKRTMTIAEQLYGVTMQEQGVSKRVAVKFDQVDAQGRINETAAA